MHRVTEVQAQHGLEPLVRDFDLRQVRTATVAHHQQIHPLRGELEFTVGVFRLLQRSARKDDGLTGQRRFHHGFCWVMDTRKVVAHDRRLIDEVVDVGVCTPYADDLEQLLHLHDPAAQVTDYRVPADGLVMEEDLLQQLLTFRNRRIVLLDSLTRLFDRWVVVEPQVMDRVHTPNVFGIVHDRRVEQTLFGLVDPVPEFFTVIVARAVDFLHVAGYR
ncbi:hypothetical protein D3C86_1371960 [compost metagenome]